MTKNRLKRVLALAMAFVLTVGAVIPTSTYANATGPGADVAASNRRSESQFFMMKQTGRI